MENRNPKMEWVIYLLVLILIILVWFNLKKEEKSQNRLHNPFHQHQKERFS